MNFCKNCLMPVDEDNKFCNNCGTDLSSEDNTTDIQPDDTSKFPDLASVEPYSPLDPQPQVTVETVPVHTFIEKEDIGILGKIGLLFLAVSMSPIGLIVGLIMMSGREKVYKAFGQIMVIVSAIMLFSSVLCCCAVYFSSISILREYGGYFY